MNGMKILTMALDQQVLFTYPKQRNLLGKLYTEPSRVDNVWYIQDHGSEYDTGTATHHLTMYKAASGAIVCVTLCRNLSIRFLEQELLSGPGD